MPTDTVSYTYSGSEWSDLLTSYDGNTITSDEIGNMLSDGTWTYTWEHGRELASMTDGTNTWTYTYNAEGLRTKKTNGTDSYTYVYNGSQLVQMTKGTDTLYFSYDANGTPMTVTYNGAVYYYVTNLQGDITRILDSSGNPVVAYTYDTTWGFPIALTGSMASTLGVHNPLRYRSYIYDAETGLYYVSSRYYDPEIGRFINADSQLNQKDGILGYNMFAYCHNNPIMYSDPTGHSITLACIIIGAVIGAVAGGCAGAYVSKKQTGKVNGWAVAAGAVGGGVVGGLVGWGVGAAITAVGAAATGSAATAAAPVVQQVAEKASTALQTYYPPNDGFSGAVQKITLEAGTLIQRTGDLVGRYIAPAGTPTQMLSLPYDKIGQPTTILQVQQSVEVLAGRVAPWFGQIGGGIQYQLGTPLDQLISEGIIKIFGG